MREPILQSILEPCNKKYYDYEDEWQGIIQSLYPTHEFSTSFNLKCVMGHYGERLSAAGRSLIL